MWEKVGFICILAPSFNKNTVINIIGTYECKADAKGRVMFPAALKKQLHKVIEEGFVIKRSVFNPCLEIYPMCEWNEVVGQVNQLNRFVKKNNDFIRSYMAGLKFVEVDSSGRFLIPKDLFVFASLQKEIVLSSSVSMIEIWDKTSYEISVSETLKDFGNLAEEIMGNKAINELDDLS